MDEGILFTCEVNSFYGNKHSLAHLYITKEEIIMTRQSLWNMKVGTHGKTTTTAILTQLFMTHRPIMSFIGGIAKNFNNNFLVLILITNNKIV